MDLYLDWNNTLQNQQQGVIDYIKQQFNIQLSLADFSEWDPKLGHKLNISDEEFNELAWNSEWVFKNSKPFEGVKEHLERLACKHHLIIATSASKPDLIEPWFKQFEIPYHDILCLQDKNSIKGLLIDDSPMTLYKRWSNNLWTIRFELAWNSHLTQLPAMKTWALSSIGESM